MADDVYLAVPLDDEDDLDNAVERHVNILAVEMGGYPLEDDDATTTLYVVDSKLAMDLALEILRQVKERESPDDEVKIRVHASIRLDDFHCERLTEDEARAVHARYLARMEEL